MQSAWTVERARSAYAIPHWSEGYFDVDAKGRLVVLAQGSGGPAVVMDDVVGKTRELGLRLPFLARFPSILADRLKRLQGAFSNAMKGCNYSGGYTAIYPIKVNQQHGVVSELINAGTSGFGLEAGSKPELMAVLALAKAGSTVICNGYKDREYLRLALIGRKLGLDLYIVIEKPTELKHVIEEAALLGVEPRLGVRLRLASLGAGKWQNTGGDKGKFGLSPHQVLELIANLKKENLDHTLQLLHFHMGSQISNVRDIANGMREAVRYFVELSKLGLTIKHMDVGGGLGVDYEGTRSRSDCSINYGLDQYAATIVQPLAEACAEHGLPMPQVLTEAGRAMTAHHAVLVVNVSEVEPAPSGEMGSSRAGEPAVLRHLREIYAELNKRPPLEIYHEAQQHLAEGQALYALGQLGLEDRARLDDFYYATVRAVHARLKPDERSHRQALDELNQLLVDKYFVNFSVFESIPDVWGIDQVFPIVPLTRLDEAPQRRGVLADLTCDSDGRVDHYVGADGVGVSLPLHALESGSRYRLGIFMVGAYQETLGDIHNLFGDTDAVNVRLTATGFELTHLRHGDTADKLLDYVGYDIAVLRARYQQKIEQANLDVNTAQRLRAYLEAGLTGYTYLEEAPHP